jgi:inner membrane protein
VWIAGAACAVFPDLDVITFRLGIPYDAMLGHRGLSHSIVFAGAFAAAIVAVFFRETRERTAWPRLWMYLTLATISHGVLDAFTNGGLGVAFFSPIDTTRYFFPWRPIEVSPIGIGRFFSARGMAVLWSELRWTLLPAAIVAAVVLRIRGYRTLTA